MHRPPSVPTLLLAAATLLATTAWADPPGGRRELEHAALRQRLTAAWKGPITDALRDELRRHASLIARLQRVEALAESETDKDSADQARKLIGRENARHERWFADHGAAEVKR